MKFFVFNALIAAGSMVQGRPPVANEDDAKADLVIRISLPAVDSIKADPSVAVYFLQGPLCVPNPNNFFPCVTGLLLEISNHPNH